MADIVEKLLDLHKQAITEESHYYTAKAIEEAVAEINRLRRDAKLWRCKLMEVDLEENWMKVKIPQTVMAKGFSPGCALIDFTEIQ